MITINEYFDGAVKSLGYQSDEGQSTIGVIEVGEYEFGTTVHETMQVIEGKLDAILPGEDDWQAFNAGEAFKVQANQSFKVRASQQTSYLCKYK